MSPHLGKGVAVRCAGELDLTWHTLLNSGLDASYPEKKRTGIEESTWEFMDNSPCMRSQGKDMKYVCKGHATESVSAHVSMQWHGVYLEELKP